MGLVPPWEGWRPWNSRGLGALCEGWRSLRRQNPPDPRVPTTAARGRPAPGSRGDGEGVPVIGVGGRASVHGFQSTGRRSVHRAPLTGPVLPAVMSCRLPGKPGRDELAPRSLVPQPSREQAPCLHAALRMGTGPARGLGLLDAFRSPRLSPAPQWQCTARGAQGVSPGPSRWCWFLSS